jgi:hypothetical protein
MDRRGPAGCRTSTVGLKLIPARLIPGVCFSSSSFGGGQLTAVAVLSPSILLLSHHDRTLEALTHWQPPLTLSALAVTGRDGQQIGRSRGGLASARPAA